MKKILILVLIVLLIALTIFLGVKGIKIGKFEILGIKGIKEKNDALDLKIQEAAKLVEKDYKKAISDVQMNAKKLQEEKKNYEDMITITGEGTQATNQIEKYEIETLWVRLGNHATSEGVVMQMDVIRAPGSAQDVYNLRFTATGSYISITDFISAIENDSTLGFKIEDFSMIPAKTVEPEEKKEKSTTNNKKESATDEKKEPEEKKEMELQATFVCKDISIKDVSIMTTTTNNNTAETEDQTNTNNTQNTTNTNSTNNTTNTSNKSNTTNTNVAK